MSDNRTELEKDLSAEKSLFQIFCKSLKLSRNKFNIYVCFIVLIILAIYVFLNKSIDINILLDQLRSSSKIGLNLAACIIGFVIAGFTIFASTSNSELLLAMAKAKDSKFDMSFFKVYFYSMLYVFIVYLVFLSLSVIIVLFAQSNGVISYLIKLYFNGDGYYQVRSLLIQVTTLSYYLYFVYSLLILKSFIYNVYQSVLTMIDWEDIKQQEAAND